MKTLDEVIAYFNNQCQMRHVYLTEDADARFAEALHYLKVFRDAKATLEFEKDNYRKAVDNCEKAELKYTKMVLDMNRNDPLTWDELKAMGGKPVWVEIIGRTIPLDSSWGIATGGSYHTWQGVESWRLVRPGAEYSLPVAQYGKTWQAYRKERE